MFTAAQGKAASEILAVIEAVKDKSFAKNLKAALDATQAHDKARDAAKAEREGLAAKEAAMDHEADVLTERAEAMDARDAAVSRAEQVLVDDADKVRQEGAKSAQEVASRESDLERGQRELAAGREEIENQKVAVVGERQKMAAFTQRALDDSTSANAKKAEYGAALEKLRAAAHI